MVMKTEKRFILLILFFLVALPGIHKLIGPIPPPWFITKFQLSFLTQLPGGLKSIYLILMLLELFTALSLFILLVLSWTSLNKLNTLFNIAFIGLQILFVILFFGSFLVEDYDNGFMDLMYFTGVLILKRIYITNKAMN